MEYWAETSTNPFIFLHKLLRFWVTLDDYHIFSLPHGLNFKVHQDTTLFFFFFFLNQ